MWFNIGIHLQYIFWDKNQTIRQLYVEDSIIYKKAKCRWDITRHCRERTLVIGLVTKEADVLGSRAQWLHSAHLMHCTTDKLLCIISTAFHGSSGENIKKTARLHPININSYNNLETKIIFITSRIISLILMRQIILG